MLIPLSFPVDAVAKPIEAFSKTEVPESGIAAGKWRLNALRRLERIGELFQITPRVVVLFFFFLFFFLTLLVITYLVFYNVVIRDANITRKASGKIEICLQILVVKRRLLSRVKHGKYNFSNRKMSEKGNF